MPSVSREVGTLTTERTASERGLSLQSDVVFPGLVVTHSDPPVSRVPSSALEKRRSATVRPEAGSRRVSS
jgi:hypothetical protein